MVRSAWLLLLVVGCVAPPAPVLPAAPAELVVARLDGCRKLAAREPVETLAHMALATERRAFVVEPEEHLEAELDRVLVDLCRAVADFEGRRMDADAVVAFFETTSRALGASSLRYQHVLIQYFSDTLRRPRRADCDTLSLFYVSLAELLGLPVRFAEVPGHNFVRYEQGPLRINGDPNDLAVLSDDHLRARWGVTAANAGEYDLKSFSPAKVRAYWSTIASHDLDEKYQASGDEKYRTAERALRREAAELAPDYGRVLNRMAWSLLTDPDPRERDPALALTYAERAVARARDPDWLDTLAVARAAAGRFAEAVALMDEALAGKNEEEFRARRELFRAGRPYEPWNQRR